MYDKYDTETYITNAGTKIITNVIGEITSFANDIATKTDKINWIVGYTG